MTGEQTQEKQRPTYYSLNELTYAMVRSERAVACNFISSALRNLGMINSEAWTEILVSGLTQLAETEHKKPSAFIAELSAALAVAAPTLPDEYVYPDDDEETGGA